MGSASRVAAVSGAGRQSRSHEGKTAGEVVEDGKRGMGGGDPGARVVIPDCERAAGVSDYGRDGGKVEASADRDRVQQRVRSGVDEARAQRAGNAGTGDGPRHRIAERGDAALF